jgi:hypothetical protein
MSLLRLTGTVLVLALQCLFFPNTIFAHPPSGIVVDVQGHVYILYRGVVRIESSGKITTIQEDSAAHWLALGSRNDFSSMPPVPYKRVTSDGFTLVFGEGAPLVIGTDGNLYYGSNGSRSESFPTGAMTVVKLSASGQRSLFAPSLHQELTDLKDGITGLATGSDGSIYVATWNGILKLNGEGSLAKIMHPVSVKDCDSDPADHNPANAHSPLLCGLGVDSDGNVYVAATSCHRVLKITPSGHVESILKSERPWSPTGIAVSGRDIYVLEYTNANGPKTEGWYPRVRHLGINGTWKTLLSVSPETSSAITNPN